MCNCIIGWVRDRRGKVTKRTLNDICNAITTFCGGSSFDGGDGLAPTTPYVLEVYAL